MNPSPIRIQYHTPERHPSLRADVAALFGRYLPRHGILASLVTMDQHQDRSAPWEGGVDLVLSCSRRRSVSTLRLISHRLRCLFVTSWHEVDAILIRDMPSLAAVAWIACRLRGRPFLYWMSFPIVEGYGALARSGPARIGWIRWAYARLREVVGRLLLYRLALPRAEHVFVQSNAMRDAVLALGCRPDRVTAVPMGVDLEEMDIARIPPLDDPRLAGRQAVVYAGTLSSTRRLDILLEGFARARARCPQALLVMIGREDVPGERDALLDAARRLGIEEHIVWTGWIPRQEAAAWIRACVVGVSLVPRGPMFDVSSPTKLCEYMAMGVPGLVNDIPDQAWVAEQSGAARVVDMSPDSIGDGLCALLGDPGERERMAQLGPAFVRAERSYAVIAQRLASLLHRLLRPAAAMAPPPEAR